MSSNINNVKQLNVGQGAQRYLPSTRVQPHPLMQTFGQVLGGAVNFSRQTFSGNALGGGVSNFIDSNPIFAAQNALIEKQAEMQLMMMQVSMESNVSRSKHEAKMAAVRNVRVA